MAIANAGQAVVLVHAIQSYFVNVLYVKSVAHPVPRHFMLAVSSFDADNDQHKAIVQS
jgi:hypothetical protein